MSVFSSKITFSFTSEATSLINICSTNPKENKKTRLTQVSPQLGLALASKDTPQGVKDCLETIVFNASSEANLPLGDFTLAAAAFPHIIENLKDEYARAIVHSVSAIIEHDTPIQTEVKDGSWKLDQTA